MNDISTTSWMDILNGGISTAIDGHFQKETAKHTNTERTPPVPTEVQPVTPPAAIAGTLAQNYQVGGIAVNKTLATFAGGALLVALVLKAVK